MFEWFTEPARQVMGLACEEADRLRHNYVGPEHVLAALARQESSPAGIRAGSERCPRRAGQAGRAGGAAGPVAQQADLLASLGIDFTSVQRAIEESFGAEAVCAASLARAGALGCGRTGSSSPAH